MTVVFYDFETAGLERHHPNTQIAAIAYDLDNGVELESFNSLIKFDENEADPSALALNHYDAARWAAQAEDSITVRNKFSKFLNRHKMVERISSKTGKPFYVARLGGYNNLVFDDPRLRDWFAGEFIPADYQTLDVKQLAQWYFQSIGVQTSLRLSNVCGLLGIQTDHAHDALADVRYTAAAGRELLRRMYV